MKADFLILWVDDNKLMIDSLVPSLEGWLEEKGFELKVLPHKDETNVLDDIKNYDIELIVIDYKMPKKNGDEVIKDIRKNGCYQDIVFYSEGALPKEPFDGVFFVSKEDAKTRIKELINLKLLRSSDPIGVRGWIVADAIELEGMVNELLIRCYTHREGFNFTDRLFFSDSNPLEFGTKVGMLNGIFKDRISLLKTQGVKDGSVEQLEAYKNIFDSFQKEVVEIRNIVAHQRIEETEKGKAIKRKSTNVLEDATTIKIRKNLRKHRDNLIAISYLNGMTDFLSKEKRSKVMSAIRSEGNATTELAMIRLFRENKIAGWRRNYKLQGKPDFVFPKDKLVVFVDGCFWHRHICLKPRDSLKKRFLERENREK